MVATTQEPQDHDPSSIQDTAFLTTPYSQTEMNWSTIVQKHPLSCVKQNMLQQLR
jgi:hypothetical protein